MRMHPCNRILKFGVSVIASIKAQDVGFGELSGAYVYAALANAGHWLAVHHGISR